MRFYYRELLLDEKHINEIDEHGLGISVLAIFS